MVESSNSLTLRLCSLLP